MKTRLYTPNVKLVLVASFFFLMSPMLINPVIAGFARNIGASSVFAGIVAGLTNLTSLVLRPLAGNLTDRVSKYHLTLVGGCLLLAASLGYSLTTNLTLITAFRILNGVGYTLCSVCMATWMASLLPPDRIGSGMGIYGLANALGMACGPAISVYLYQHYSYQSVFWLAAVCSGLLVVMIQFVTDRGVPVKRAATPTGAARHLRLVHPKVLPVAVILLLFSLPYFATQTYIVTYVAARHFHVAVGLFFPVYAIILLVLRLTLRDLFDRVPFSKFIWICLLFNLAGLVGLADMTNWLMMLVAALGLAAGYGLMFSICQAKAMMLVSEADHGLANSTFYIGVDLGMSLGPMIGGLISSALPMAWFYPVMMVITLPLIVVVYWVNRRTLA